MRIQDIEIHVGAVDFDYERLRRLEVKVEATTMFNPAPTIDEANLKLRELAAKVGANAVVDVAYNSGISMTSWRSMTATGLAVRRESDDVACGVCAETIKRAAKKCRFCGADRGEAVAQPTAGEPKPQQIAAPRASSSSVEEPLKATNNTGIYWVMAIVALGLFIPMLSMCSG